MIAAWGQFIANTDLQCSLQERYKELEKEAKIKPFAKAGLEQKDKADPALEAKLTCEHWLGNSIATLAEQIEMFEVFLSHFLLWPYDFLSAPHV